MSQVTRFPNGLTDAKKDELWGEFGQLDPRKYSTFFEDFFYLNLDDWVFSSTEAGAGTATEAITDAKNGVILITTDDADNDNTFVYKKGESFQMESGKKFFYEVRFKTSDATQTDIIAGLAISDSSPLTTVDGIFFRKDDGDTDIGLYLEVATVETAVTGVATLADDTYIRLGFSYNGVDEVTYYVDGVKTGTQTILTTLTTTELTAHIGIQNGEAAAKTLSVDYIMVAQER